MEASSMKKLLCQECGDRTCTLTTNRAYKQAPETCPWSNTVDEEVYAPFSEHKGPADIVKKEVV